MPFLMADGTSLALPMPKPATPWPSPTTTRALKLRFLPPLTTLVTRLIDTTVSLMSSCDGSMRSRVFIVHFALGPHPQRLSRLAPSLAAVVETTVRLEKHCAGPLSIRPSELQTRFAGRVGDGANAAVIE